MRCSDYCAVAFRPAVGLRYLAGFFAYGLGLSTLYALTGIGLACPLRAVTGWQCPLCGSTRMGDALLHGDVLTAWRYNPVVLVGLVVLGVLAVLWSVEVLGGPRVPPPVRLAGGLRRVHPTRWLVLVLAAATLYTLLRHLL